MATAKYDKGVINLQFLIIGYDGKDDQSPERRFAARPQHLENVKIMKEAGKLLYAGAMLDDSGQMIGSVVIGEFENEQALRNEWLESEPYVLNKVWETIEIKPFATASIFK